MTTYSTPSLTIRLFNNPKFGKPTGPKRQNQIVFNGSVKFASGSMFIDLATVDNIEQVVSADFEHMTPLLAGLAEKIGAASAKGSDILVGQLKFVEGKQREFMDGGVAVNLSSRIVRAFLRDEQGRIILNETMDLFKCRTQRNEQRSPDYIASTEEQRAAASGASKQLAASILDELA